MMAAIDGFNYAGSEMAYPGGKNGAGVYQRIINHIPPHRVYIESHLGGGAIMRLKKAAAISIGIDIDNTVLASGDFPGVKIINDDAVKWLENYQFQGDEFLFCDPPYVMSSRRSGQIYNHEYSDQQHIELLKVIKKLPCNVAISGYYTDLYNDQLSGWRQISLPSMTRGGKPENEYLWMNYDEPLQLHDYQYLGENFTDRQRIKRKLARWEAKFKLLPLLERQLISLALKNSQK